MNKELLKNIIIDQSELFSEKLKSENIIEREGLYECRKYIEHPNILLISGLRRAGKSVFSHLLTRGENCPFINFDDERLASIKTKDLNTILECFYELYGDFEFVLFDELQNIPNWELFINRLREKYKIIITGSNANLLSSELATHITGRYIAFTIFPLNFREYLKFKYYDLQQRALYSTREKSKITSIFSEYLRDGGIFEHHKFGKEFTRNLFSSIINKDILVRYGVKYPVVLEELALLLVNYFTSRISVNNITKTLKIKSSHTIREYIKYLENTFLIFTINKFSYKVKEQLSSFKKVYITDNGIINSLIFDFSHNKGKLLENLVAIELKRRSLNENFEVFYWTNYRVECDFIIKKNRNIVFAYQVCSQLTLNNRKREFNGLIAALEEFKLNEGIILTESTEEILTVNGYTIKVIPTWKWMLEN